MKKFTVGDRVIAIAPVDGNESLVGMCGTVVSAEQPNARSGYQYLGVEFDIPFVQGHSCGGNCPDGKGRFGYSNEFDLEENQMPELTLDDDEIAWLDEFLSTYQK